MSFSDSDLAVEHFYPKYDYSDYKEIQEEDEEDERELTGLSLRVHPSLRAALAQPLRSTTSDSNVSKHHQRPSPSNARPSSPEASYDLDRYTPRFLSSYEDEIQQHLTGHYSVSVDSDGHDGTSESTDAAPMVEEPPLDDFYASLDTNPSALIW